MFIYILEAHAKDEWPIKELEPETPQHKSLDDRINAACNFFANYSVHEAFVLAADNSKNDFIDLYCSWPFRYWIMDGGRIALKCMPDGDKVSLEALENWCGEYVRAIS